MRELAPRVGLAPSTLYEIESGRQESTTKLHRIAAALRVSATYLEIGKGPAEAIAEPLSVYGTGDGLETQPGPHVSLYSAAPIVGTASLGDDGFWLEFDHPVGHGDGFLDVPTKDPNAYAIRLKGQSMFPAIRDGWYAVIEPNSPLQIGEYVYVKTKNGQCMVKELLWHKNGEYALESVNKDHARITLQESEIETIQFVAFIAPPSKRRMP